MLYKHNLIAMLVSLLILVAIENVNGHTINGNGNSLAELHLSGNKISNKSNVDTDRFVNRLFSPTSKSRQKRQHTVLETVEYDDAYKARLVDYHNQMRREEPNTANMLKQFWSDDMASYAQEWSETCATVLDVNDDPHGNYPAAANFFAQNAGLFIDDGDIPCAFDAWATAISSWYFDERPAYDHEAQMCTPVGDITTCGHYKVMVQAQALEVGCGHAYCDQNTTYYFMVCNYARITTVASIPGLFVEGSACSDCPTGYEQCDDGLCTDSVDPFYEVTAFSYVCDPIADPANTNVASASQSATCSSSSFFLPCSAIIDGEETNAGDFTPIPSVTLTIRFADYNTVRVVRVVQGETAADKNIEDLQLTFDDGTSQTITLVDRDEGYNWEIFVIDPPVVTDRVRLNIQSNYGGTTFIISEVEIYTNLARSETLTQDMKDEFVNLHNQQRRLRGASDMLEMEWNDDLASFSYSYFPSICSFELSDASDRIGYGGESSNGENIYISPDGDTSQYLTYISDAIQSWYAEGQYYDDETMTCEADQHCSYYTQLVWKDSYKLGCSIVTCPAFSGVDSSYNGGTMIVCNYGPGGNEAATRPYTEGDACCDCPSDFSYCDTDLCTADSGDTAATEYCMLDETTESGSTTANPTTNTGTTDDTSDESSAIRTEITLSLVVLYFVLFVAMISISAFA